MPRPRTPKALARITGADLQHPGRFAARKAPKVGALGEPPTSLTLAQRIAWDAFAAELPWLGRSDRMLVELAARLRARIEIEPNAPISAYGELRMCISKMGGTPSDRSRADAGVDADDTDRFFN